MTEPSRAVFLSYASEDAKAARRIADTLTAAGIEVWLDQSELRGGEAPDRLSWFVRRLVGVCDVPARSRRTQFSSILENCSRWLMLTLKEHSRATALG